MRFEKIGDAGSYATVRLDTEPDGRPVAVVQRTNEKGKSTEKRVKSTGKYSASSHDFFTRNTLDKALVALLKDGYVARSAGPIVWMTHSDEGFPMGRQMGVDDAGRVWVGDTGFLRRVDQRTGDTTSIALGEGMLVRAVATGPNGNVAVLAEPTKPYTLGEGAFKPPTEGGRYLVFRVVDGTSTEVIASVDFTKFTSARIASTVGVTAAGRVLGPHEDGAALYEADGAVVRTFPVRKTTFISPVVAIDGDGKTIVVTNGDGKLLVIDLESKTEKDLGGSFGSVDALEARADGSVIVWEHSGDWGVYRLTREGRCTKLSPERVAHAGVSADGKIIAACEVGGTLAIRDTQTGETTGSMPLLGAGKSARLVFSNDGGLFARTDSGITLALDPQQIDKTLSLQSLL